MRGDRFQAFGNSDGDFEMLEYTTAGPGRRLALICTTLMPIASGRTTATWGRLERALDEADPRRWIVADMKRDWKTIYPSKQEERCT